MGKMRRSPQRLASKLKTIRERLGASQSEMAKLLEFNDRSPARISEWESGIRQPDLLTLLRYAHLSQTSTDTLIDDRVDLVFPKPRRRGS